MSSTTTQVPNSRDAHTIMTNINDVYTTPTPYTAFDDWASFSPAYGDNILSDPQSAIDLANDLVAHYTNSEFHKMAPERADDLELRSVRDIIARYHTLNTDPAASITPVGGRCRDLALLVCSQFRAQGVPARLRFGFTHMYYDTKRALADHVVVEYFDEGRWKILEPRGSSRLMAHQDLGINPIDVDPKKFINGPRAWHNIRNKNMRAEWFSGTTPNAQMGLWYVRKIMLFDLASLCRYEADVFDLWGYLTDSKPGVMPKFKPHLDALDNIAATDFLDEQAFAECYQLLVQDERFLPDGEISVSPTLGKRSTLSVRKEDYVLY
ncbi:transglutaminase domain-containing protein [Enterovibrio norvegicus]|uniref:Transglutaminase-like superfamily protein n=1 Tax=Enterovibrio norvegicus DSM 15893 TaxID=1121869 RepID=A0A1I5WTB9_9GAMM|nr:transglutaminase domain-containing protein [Enterovibrio norvegicus]SFQ23012.1 Transglutaminase-like superfamily protein [Enterovibrio norvegicus DSM 15893]